MRNYTFRVIEGGKVVQGCSTHNRRRFLNQTRLIRWGNRHLKVILRVNYGKHKNILEKLSLFLNEGIYETRRDFTLAVKAFMELNYDI